MPLFGKKKEDNWISTPRGLYKLKPIFPAKATDPEFGPLLEYGKMNRDPVIEAKGKALDDFNKKIEDAKIVNWISDNPIGKAVGYVADEALHYGINALPAGKGVATVLHHTANYIKNRVLNRKRLGDYMTKGAEYRAKHLQKQAWKNNSWYTQNEFRNKRNKYNYKKRTWLPKGRKSYQKKYPRWNGTPQAWVGYGKEDNRVYLPNTMYKNKAGYKYPTQPGTKSYKIGWDKRDVK